MKKQRYAEELRKAKRLHPAPTPSQRQDIDFVIHALYLIITRLPMPQMERLKRVVNKIIDGQMNETEQCIDNIIARTRVMVRHILDAG